jgi:predicted restriction endonuclease
MLAESLTVEVTFLDAHTFAWMLVGHMEHENMLADVQEYLNLSSSEREAVVKARIGQGRFRDSLIAYWSTCAVTGCMEDSLLRASHIKPWAKASLPERLSLYNGLLLSPALDACFDSGYVSFDDEGKILLTRSSHAKVWRLERSVGSGAVFAGPVSPRRATRAVEAGD